MRLTWQSVALAAILLLMFTLLDSPTWEIWKFATSADLRLQSKPISTSQQVVINEHSANPLQSFIVRGYHSETMSCSNIHQLSQTIALQCEGMQTSKTCGDVPLIPGLCTTPQNAKYVFTSHIPPLIQTSSCREFNKSIDFSLGSFTSAGLYDAPPSMGCSLVDLNPIFLHQQLKGRRILFFGDSHARNLFTAFVAEVRNQKFVVERHVDKDTKDTLLPYQVFNFNAELDEFQDYIGGKQGIKLKECDPASGCCGVQVVFIWSGFPLEYSLALLGPVAKLKPDVIITAFLSKAYTAEMDFNMAMNNTLEAFEKYLRKQKRVHLVIAPFPLHGGDLVYSTARVWLHAHAAEHWAKNTLLLDQSQFLQAFMRAGGQAKQLAMLSHTVCALYDTYSLEPSKRETDTGGVKIAAYETCTAPIDRAIVRTAITFVVNFYK